MYATDDLEDALVATREFLLPVEWGRWWRLALMALFLSGGTALNPPTVQTGLPTSVGGTAPTDPGMTDPGIPDAPLDALPADLVALAVLLAVVGILVGIVLAAVGAVMEFVLVEVLRQETVAVRRFFARHWRRGLRLFAFNVGLGLLSLVVVGGLISFGLAPLLVVDSLWLTVLALVLVVPLVLAVGLVAAAAFVFTSAFVVPTMVIEDCGVLDGWRRFWPVLRREVEEYLAFGLVYVALLLVVGVATGIVVGVGGLLLALPFGIVAAGGVALLGGLDAAGIGLLAVVGLLWLLSVVALYALVQVPVVTYLRYYSLFVLGDTEPSLDLLPERRAAVRGE